MSDWSDFMNSLDNDEFPELASPKFKLQPQQKVFTIGSSLARYIEESLSNKLIFPIMDYEPRLEEYVGDRPRQILNSFTPHSIVEELKWFWSIESYQEDFNSATTERFLYEIDDSDDVIDLGLQQYKPVTQHRFLERRLEIFALLQNLKDVDCIVITLDHVEQFYHHETAIQHAPVTEATMPDDGLFSGGPLDHDITEGMLFHMVEIIKTVNPSVKVIFSVSPDPLEDTVTMDHIYIANARSKSRLISAAYSMALEDNVDYFPSYEIISHLGQQAYEPDRLKLKKGAKDLLCNEFFIAYLC